MITRFELKNVVFLEDHITEWIPGFPLGHFAISMNGMRKRVYLGMYYNDPETGKLAKERSFKKDFEIIKNLIPGQLVNLVVNVWDATPKDARRDVFSLGVIQAA